MKRVFKVVLVYLDRVHLYYNIGADNDVLARAKAEELANGYWKRGGYPLRKPVYANIELIVEIDNPYDTANADDINNVLNGVGDEPESPVT